MSDSTKYPIVQCLAVATEVRNALQPLCEQVEIVGSIRRAKPFCSDIELLFIPKKESRPDPDNMFGRLDVNLVDELVGKWLEKKYISKRPDINGRFSWGDSNKLAVHLPSGIPLDLFATTQKNWWNSIVIRTGSKETNLSLTTGAISRARSLLAYGNGIRITVGPQTVGGVNYFAGDVIQTNSEREVFELCGVPYKQPTER